jgi:hypothetical protein
MVFEDELLAYSIVLLLNLLRENVPANIDADVAAAGRKSKIG